jgi:glycerol-3-phosphate dehydrogenase
MNRNKLIADLQLNKGIVWDIIIIGGGATGLGIALDAATRGYKTILFEQYDFSQATSSRSTKLVHGGVRYMAQGDLLLVVEALKERGRLLRNAPGLTENQEFIIPVYTLWDVILYTVGLKFYDLLAGKLSLGKSYFISRRRVIERLPLIRAEGLRGGIVYHDGQFDDSRLAISLACSAVEKGALLLNYFIVKELNKNEKGIISGVEVVDQISGKEYQVRSKLVINATGVFADNIHRMDDPSSGPTLRPSQGVHIVLDSGFLQSSSAIMIPKTDDGRVLFAIPWYDKVVVGTTDTPLNNIEIEPIALDEEITFILNTAGRYLTRPPERKDVLSIFAGLRPLAAAAGKTGSTKEISRRHKITISPSGLLSITGGKWTTYRCMAEETLERAVREGILEKRPCITGDFVISGITPQLSDNRLKIYGKGATEIESMISVNPETGAPLCKEFQYCRAEIIWIIKNEMPCTVYDILSRRTRALLLDAKASLKIAPLIASMMAGELGKDKKWEKEQVSAFNELVLNYL